MRKITLKEKKFLEIKNFASTFSVLWLSKGTQKMIWTLTFKGQENPQSV